MAKKPIHHAELGKSKINERLIEGKGNNFYGVNYNYPAVPINLSQLQPLLDQLVESGAIAPLVVVPFIYILGGSFAPCEIVAIFLRAVGSNVHRCPQGAAGQAQVNIFMGVFFWNNAQQDVINLGDVIAVNTAISVNITIGKISHVAIEEVAVECCYIRTCDNSVTIYIAINR